MLALQHPSMGSSKPTNRDLPFGYDFDAPDDFPFSPPPAPAPGPSLLDDADSKLLGDFFDGVSSDHFNGIDFFDRAFGMSGSGGYELPFGWSELPPTFMGTSSSFRGVQQPTQQPAPGFSDNDFAMMGSEIPAGTSADIIAATTLMGGSNSSLHYNTNESIGQKNDFFSANDSSRTLQTGPSISNQPRGPLHATSSMTPFPASRGPPVSAVVPSQRKDDFMGNEFYNDLVFESTPNPSSRSNKPEEIQWGSDSGFGAASFIAPPGQESRKRIEKEMLKQLECFQPKTDSLYSSSNTTRPSSPLVLRLDKEDPSKNKRQSIKLIGSTSREETSVGAVAGTGHVFRNRRKSASVVKKEDDEDDDITHRIPSVPSRKRKQQTLKSTEPSPAATKRRKSNVAHSNNGGDNCSSNDGKGKSTRENLTEDQKRENHIRSEQKRRTLIKEGFEDLGELVPELASGGFSKSAVLLTAGDWLEDLLKGNEVLRKQLANLEGRE